MLLVDVHNIQLNSEIEGYYFCIFHFKCLIDKGNLCENMNKEVCLEVQWKFHHIPLLVIQ